MFKTSNIKNKALISWVFYLLSFPHKIKAFFIFIPFLIVFHTSSADSLYAEHLSQHIANYRMNAELNPENHTIIGQQTLEWNNTTHDTIRELHFHLYANAFKDQLTTFMKESESYISRRFGLKEHDAEHGWIEIEKMVTSEGANLIDSIQYIQADDGNAHDRTVIRVPLPAPILPRRSIHMCIDFQLKIPDSGARIGYYQEYHLVSQWFPKIGVYEPAGSRYPDRGNWNCHQYHAASEFYADFGSYEVRLTVPRGYLVGATGRQTEHESTDSTETFVFYQEDVHDFAWAADPDFIKIIRIFDADKEVSAAEINEYAELFDLPAEDILLSDVKIILLIQPYKTHLIERYIAAVKAAIKYYGLWYGRYPYSTITIVDPPDQANSTGGMEYPTFFTGGSPYLPSKSQLNPELVTIHEFGHNYWYGIVANNEFEEAWLDEGINTYSEWKVTEAAYGPNSYNLRFSGFPMSHFLPHLSTDAIALHRLFYQLFPDLDRLVQNSWDYRNMLSYGINAYYRPALYLSSLERFFGKKLFFKMLRTFYQRQRFKHPTTRDFMNVVNELSGQNYDWLFDQLFFDVKTVDYKIESITSIKSDTAIVFNNEVIVVREGDGIFPVEIEIIFENGETIIENWDGRYRWYKFQYDRPSRIRSATVDPEGELLFDINICNNSKTSDFSAKAFIQVNRYILFYIQLSLKLISVIV